MDYKALQQNMFQNQVYDAWQFVNNSLQSINTAHYCIKIISELVKQYAEEYNGWITSIFDDLFKPENTDGNIHRVNVTSEMLPKHMTKVAGLDVRIQFLTNKLTKDFFQYARNTFDYIAQIANSACLATRRKKIESVDFQRMTKVFAQLTYSQSFPAISSWFATTSTSAEFIYLDAFCNRTKHISDVSLKLSISILGGESKAIINPFYKKETQYSAQDIKTYLTSIIVFVEKALDDFLCLLQPELPNKTYVQNRFHQLEAYQQRLKDSPNSNFSMVYITAPSSDINSVPEEIEVLFEREDATDGHIDARNCSVNKIYIRDPADEHTYMGYFEAVDDYVDDALLQYRRYKRIAHDPQDTPLIFSAMLEPENKDRFYHLNPYISFTTVSDDPEFLKRIQMPF